MKFPPSDQAAMLAAFGSQIIIGAIPVTGLYQSAGKVVQLFDGQIVTTGPIITLSESDAEMVDENSTIISVDGTQFQATQKLPDGAGFVDIELTKDF